MKPIIKEKVSIKKERKKDEEFEYVKFLHIQ